MARIDDYVDDMEYEELEGTHWMALHELDDKDKRIAELEELASVRLKEIAKLQKQLAKEKARKDIEHGDLREWSANSLFDGDCANCGGHMMYGSTSVQCSLCGGTERKQNSPR